MRFDWRAFCESNNIHFVTDTSNVADNHIAIRCPFCANNDPSQHMGLSLDNRNPVWGCLRDTRHRGRNPVFLVMRLSACSLERAKAICGNNSRAYADDMAHEVAAMREIPAPGIKFNRAIIDTWERTPRQDEDEIAQHNSLQFPPSIKPIDGNGYSGPFLDYLRSRGFNDPYLPVEVADLHYAVTGDYRYRLVFPVYMSGSLVNWTARDITGRADLRYRTLSRDEEIINIKHCLYFEDRLADGGEGLFLTEGPMDALKMNCYLQPGFVATCFFGMPEPAQIIKLLYYAPRWKYFVALLDPDVPMQRLALWYGLQAANIKMLSLALPSGADDPGALLPGQVRSLARMTLRP
jgi:hypothetical protein